MDNAAVVTKKPRTRSRTHWFNAVMAGLTAAEASLNVFAPVLGEYRFALVSFVLIVGNVVLRELTTSPIE